MSTAFINALAPRRTIYGLSKTSFPLSNQQVVDIVKDIVRLTPSAFNSQTTRAIVVFGEHVNKLWNVITHDALKAVSTEESWPATEQKVKAFGASYGTVLFFEDTEIIEGMQQKFPAYAPNFPIWASQSSGAAQINVWSALALEKVGANLQHYNGLIDDAVAKTWNVPSTWKLTAQLNFGSIVAPAPEPEKLKDTVKVFE